MKQRMIRFWLGLFQAIFPEHLRRDPAYWRRLALGIVVTFLIITQLFTFEKFADITSGWHVAGGDIMAALLAGLLPLLELGDFAVFALDGYVAGFTLGFAGMFACRECSVVWYGTVVFSRCANE